jgi:nucleoside-specific outer membrane channel protein Tsx
MSLPKKNPESLMAPPAIIYGVASAMATLSSVILSINEKFKDPSLNDSALEIMETAQYLVEDYFGLMEQVEGAATNKSDAGNQNHRTPQGKV